MYIYELYSSKLRPIRRVICLVTLIAFIFNTVGTDLAWAATDQGLPVAAAHDSAGPQQGALDPGSFKLPTFLGYVKDSWAPKEPSTKAPQSIVIHIQDAHCNYKAQNALYELIEHFDKTYGVRAILLEGGEGRYDLSPFARIADPAVREKTADYFVKEGVLGGAELYAVRNPGAAPLGGVEDTLLYRENLAVYRSALRHKDEVARGLKAVGYNLSLLKTRTYPRELIALDLKTNSFNEKAIDLKEYCAYLVRSALSRGVDIADLGNIALLGKTLSLESDIDFKRSTVERDEVVDKLTKFLPKSKVKEFVERAVEFRLGRLTSSEFYTYLFAQAKSAGIDMAAYKDLGLYARYAAAYDTVKKEELFREIGRLESRIKEKLFTALVHRDLDRITRELAIIRNIFNITLTPDEFKEYNARKADFDLRKMDETIRAVAAQYGVAMAQMPDTDKLAAYLGDMERFYALSYKRDEAFLRNMRSVIARNDNAGQVTILITGGFHTENLTKLFKERGISYVSIMPNFGLDDTPSPYFKLLSGEQPPLLKSISSAMSAMAIYTYFCEKAPGIYGADIGRAREEWVEAASRILEGHEASLSGKAGTIRFVTSPVPPEGKEGEQIEKVPGAAFSGGKVYAIWAGNGAPSPAGGAVGRGVSLALKRAGAMIMIGVISFLSVFNNPAAVAAEAAGGVRIDGIPNIRIASQLESLLDNDLNAEILRDYDAASNMEELSQKFTLAKKFVEKIPEKTVKLYRELARKAGVSVDVFLMLELVETSGSDVLAPGNADLVISKSNALGPIQVMEPDCRDINKLVGVWEKEAKRTAAKNAINTEEARRGKALSKMARDAAAKRGIKRLDAANCPALISRLDTEKYRIVLEFLGFGKVIDLKKLQPGTKEYDADYARMVGVLIFALKGLDISRYRFDVSEKGYELVLKTTLHESEEPDFDQVLVTIASYSAGPKIALKALESAGPLLFYSDKRLWYKKYLDELDSIQREKFIKDGHPENEPEAPGHNTRSSMYKFLLDIFVAELNDLPALQGIEPGSIFDVLQVPVAGNAKPEEPAPIIETKPLPPLVSADIDKLVDESQTPRASQNIDDDLNRLIETLDSGAVTVDDGADAQDRADEPDSPVPASSGGWLATADSIALALAGIIAGILAARHIILKSARRRAASGRAPASSPSAVSGCTRQGAFMVGRIYDRAVIKRERSDNRFTVAIDLDNTLIAIDPYSNAILLRPEAITTLNILKQAKAKLVLWTSENKAWVQEVFAQYPDLESYFDSIITSENYLDPTRWEFFTRLSYFWRCGTYLKNVGLLGYDFLIDDKPQHVDMYYTARRGFDKGVVVTQKFGDVPVEINKRYGYRTILVSPYREVRGKKRGEGVEMVEALAAILALMPPPRHLDSPSSAGRIGHARVEEIKANLASLSNDRGKIRYQRMTAKVRNGDGQLVDLVLAARQAPYIPDLRARFDAMPDVDADKKRLLIPILTLFERLPLGSRPDFWDFTDHIDDLLGFASKHYSVIALHKELWKDPVALFHEIAEYLVKADALALKLDGGALNVSVGNDAFVMPLSPDALAIARKDPEDAHYLLRALQRECFGVHDEWTTALIREEKAKPNTAVTRPLDAISPGVAKNILVYATDTNPGSPGVLEPKLGECIITQWPLISGLRQKYPHSIIYIVTDFPHLYFSEHFGGKVVPIPRDQADRAKFRHSYLVKEGYTFDRMCGDRASRMQFLEDHTIDVVFDVARAPVHFTPGPDSFSRTHRPYIFEVAAPIRFVNAEDRLASFLHGRNSGDVALALQVSGAIGTGKRTMNSVPDSPVFIDRKGVEYTVSGIQDMMEEVALSGELGSAGVWKLAIGMYNTLGLTINKENLERSQLSMREAIAALLFFRHWHDKSGGSDEVFDPFKKIFVINVYAKTHRQDIMDERDWIELLSRLVNEVDAYFVFTSGGKMDREEDFAISDKTYVERICEGVARKAGPKANRILVPRDDIYPLINDIVAAADGIITLDTGFSHLASGVYDVPTMIITRQGIRHWLPDRSKAAPIIKDEAGHYIDEIVAAAEAVVDYHDPSKIRVAASTLSFLNRARLDSELVSGNHWDREAGRLITYRHESPAAERDLREYLERYLADLSFEETFAKSLIPKIIFVDSAIQLGINVPRFTAKLFTAERETYLLVDRSVLETADGINERVTDDAKRYDVIHEVIGHQLVRHAYPIFEDSYRASLLNGIEHDAIGTVKVEEEVLARFITLMAMNRMLAINPSLVPESMIGRAFWFDSVDPDVPWYIANIVEHLQNMDDEMATTRYKNGLRNKGDADRIAESAMPKARALTTMYFMPGKGLAGGVAEDVSDAVGTIVDVEPPVSISATAGEVARIAKDSYVMEKPCTIGMVVKGGAGSDVTRIIEEKFAREMEIIGRRLGQKIQIDRGLVQYQAGNVTYIVYVDDGTDSDENVARLAVFKARLIAAGNPRSRTFAWVLSNESRLKTVPEKIKALGLEDVANLVGLSGDYLPVSWQMLVGPLFANLVDSKQPKPEGISQDRIDAIVDAIIASISNMTRTDKSEWARRLTKLRTVSAADLAGILNGTSLIITLPPMVPVSGDVEACRKADLAVMSSL